jgi:hypothetical protein
MDFDLVTTVLATKTVRRRATAAGGAARTATTNGTTSGVGQRSSRATASGPALRDGRRGLRERRDGDKGPQ